MELLMERFAMKKVRAPVTASYVAVDQIWSTSRRQCVRALDQNGETRWPPPRRGGRTPSAPCVPSAMVRPYHFPDTTTARSNLQALAAAGMVPREDLIVGAPNYERESGYQAMQQLLTQPEMRDSVFCFNDLLALGAMRAILYAGLRIPEDIAVAGFDDIAETRFSNPRVTTVKPDLGILVDETLRLLAALIDREEHSTEDVVIPWSHQLRESTLGHRSTNGSASGQVD